ncbi:MAG: polysaccharide deacetylase family protein, partial [Hyphomicrobiaceae bacterium]
MNDTHDDSAAMKPPERIDYVPIVDRKKLSLPGGKRIIVWPVVNVEEWDVTRAMPRTTLGPPGGTTFLPDIPNWTWHEYGMRVGIWRMMETLSDAGVTPTVCLNAKVLETRPRLGHAMHEAGWEFMAHCYEQMHISKVADQRAMMRQTVDIIKAFTGELPAGWLGPGLGQTFATCDYIAEAGFRWFADYVMDDLPFWVRTT